jgi:hypothetical protein
MWNIDRLELILILSLVINYLALGYFVFLGARKFSEWRASLKVPTSPKSAFFDDGKFQTGEGVVAHGRDFNHGRGFTNGKHKVTVDRELVEENLDPYMKDLT